MTVHRYYSWALLLPLVVPFLATPLLMMGESAASVAVILQYQVLIGGVPYVLFAGAFLLWSRGRPDHQVRLGILLSPLLFAGLVIGCCLALAAVTRTPLVGFFMWMFAGWALVLGYGYVALAELGRLLVRPGREPSEPLPAQ